MAFCFQTKVSISRITALRLLGLVILMGEYFFSSCHCVPVNTETLNNEPWWCQPCKNEHRTRHSRGINEPLQTQFSIAISSYKSETKKYVDLLNTKYGYGQHFKQQSKAYNSWLPRKKFFKRLRKDDHTILPELHKNLQIYAVAFQRLLDMEIRTIDASFDMSNRIKSIETVKININGLRCEIEHEIAEKQLPAPEKVPSDFIDDKQIPSAVAHITDGLIRDYHILESYFNFIQKCYNKLFKSKKNRKNHNGNKKGDKQKNNKNKPKRTPKNKLNQKSEQS